ncbi:Gamma-aminobutyric acid type B receptor subunit 2, partial [Geodia barretti]
EIVVIVSFLFAALYYGASALNVTKPVYFSLIISGGENGSFRSSGGIPSIDIALEAVQSRRILPGYNLTYDRVRNSKCTRTDSLDAFFQETQDGTVPKIAVIGCGCSTATEPVAEISHYWNITQISFSAASPGLSDMQETVQALLQNHSLLWHLCPFHSGGA